MLFKYKCIYVISFLRGVLKQQQDSSDWGAEVKTILANGVNRPKSGHDAGEQTKVKKA